MSVFDGVRVGEFKLHSGGTSPVLFDVMAMLWNRRDRIYVRDTLTARITTQQFDTFVGIDLGGVVLATLLCEWYCDKHLGFWRKGGEVVVAWPQQRVVLVDDVITTGASVALAEAALIEAGHSVVQTVALIDRRTP